MPKIEGKISDATSLIATDFVLKYWKELRAGAAILGAVTLHAAIFVISLPESFAQLVDIYLLINISFVFILFLSLAFFLARIVEPVVYLVGWVLASGTHTKYISKSYVPKSGWTHDKGMVIDRSMGMRIRLSVAWGMEFMRAAQVGVFFVVIAEYYAGYRVFAWLVVFGLALSFFVTAAFPRLNPPIEFSDEDVAKAIDWKGIIARFWEFLFDGENRRQFLSFLVVVVLCFAAFLGYARYQFLVSITPAEAVSVQPGLFVNVLASNRSGWIAYVPDDEKHVYISHEGDLMFEAPKQRDEDV